MAHTPKDYQPLRDAHREALEKLENPVEANRDPEPTRPEQMPEQHRGWTGMGDMPSHFSSANKYNAAIVADLAARNHGDGQDAASATMSNENYTEQGVDQSQGVEQGQQPEPATAGVSNQVDDGSDRARAWLDGLELDAAQQPNNEQSPNDRDADSMKHDAVLERLDQHVDRGGGDQRADFREAARETLDRQIENGPAQGPEVEQPPPGIEI